MPGYTHMQRAQAVTLGHHLLAHAETLLRDAARFRQAYESAGDMPLGSGALAATTLAPRRGGGARAVGLTRVTGENIDARSHPRLWAGPPASVAAVWDPPSPAGGDTPLWGSA